MTGENWKDRRLGDFGLRGNDKDLAGMTFVRAFIFLFLSHNFKGKKWNLI